jgi:hypothetical protein
MGASGVADVPGTTRIVWASAYTDVALLVACTRARDHQFVTNVDAARQFFHRQFPYLT